MTTRRPQGRLRRGLGAILGPLGSLSEGSWRLLGSLLDTFLKDLCNFEQLVKIAKKQGKPMVFH